MDPIKRRTILLVGKDEALNYLLGRFAEQSECDLASVPKIISAQEIIEGPPKAIIFLSMEYLEAAQSLTEELMGLETPILVCAAVADEARARDLGADQCLLHPITYKGFQTALAAVSSPKQA